jgi:succinoglycan biosynthesis protein ExoV
MRLVMWRGAEPNFGDELNLWIWPKVIPGILDDDETDLFVGIGTLLNHRLPPQHKVVFGSGAGYGDQPDLRDGRWSIYCVRGPLTARALGLPPSTAVADPAILVNRVFHSGAAESSSDVGFMPHWESAVSGEWKAICAAADVRYIDPRDAVADVLQLVSGCRLLITEAMHGAIVADALRVPWVAAQIMPALFSFKWQDWCRSMAVEYRPLQIPASSAQEALLIRYVRTRLQAAQLYRRLKGGAAGSTTHNDIVDLPTRIDSPLVHAVNTLVKEKVVPILAGGAALARRSDRHLDIAADALRRASRLEGVLSKDETLSAKLDELETRLDRFRRDVSSGRIGASTALPAP